MLAWVFWIKIVPEITAALLPQWQNLLYYYLSLWCWIYTVIAHSCKSFSPQLYWPNHIKMLPLHKSQNAAASGAQILLHEQKKKKRPLNCFIPTFDLVLTFTHWSAILWSISSRLSKKIKMKFLGKLLALVYRLCSRYGTCYLQCACPRFDPQCL